MSQNGGRLKKWAANPARATGYQVTPVAQFVSDRSRAPERAARITAQKAESYRPRQGARRFIVEHTKLTAFSAWYAVVDVLGADGEAATVEVSLLVWVMDDDGKIKGSDLYVAVLHDWSQLLMARA